MTQPAGDALQAPDDQLELKVLARLYGEPVLQLPLDLYIPPDALEVILESFEGPLDLLLYLIRKQNFNILDIPMAEVTRQYLAYVEQLREHNLELAAEYLLMAAMLIDIKSRMLLPVRKADSPFDKAELGFRDGTLRSMRLFDAMGLALFAVSARIWLPSDMAAPAPVG